MRRYESVVILDPELANDEIVGFTERYSQVIRSNGGEIIKIEDWGPKKLAYLVKKKERGRYILFDFVGVPALIRELERQFKITEEVMKFLSVKLDEEVDLDAFKVGAEEKKVKVEPVLEEAQAPEPQVPAQPADSEEQSEVVAQVVVPQTGVEAPTGPEASAAADSGGSDDTRSAEQAKEGS